MPITPQEFDAKEQEIKEAISNAEQQLLALKELLRAYQVIRNSPLDSDPLLVGCRVRTRATNGVKKQESNDYGRDAKLVREAISAMTKNYTLHDLKTWLDARGDVLELSQITSVLSRLKRKTEIKEHQKGGARKPAIYKVSHTNGAQMSKF